MNDITHRPTRWAIRAADPISADPLQCVWAERQEKVLLDRQAESDDAREARWDEGEAISVARSREAGEAIGVLKGGAIGAAKGRAEILGNLLQLRFAAVSQPASREIPQGTEVDFKRWSARPFAAKTILEVFAYGVDDTPRRLLRPRGNERRSDRHIPLQ